MSMLFFRNSFARRRRAPGSSARASRKQTLSQPWLEGLENRIVLTSNFWTGHAASVQQDYSWSNSDNWSNGNVESGQDLVFPAAGAQTFIPAHAINNDLSNLTLDSIEIDGSGYTIDGNAITLSAPTALFMPFAAHSAYNINTNLVGGNVGIGTGGELDIGGVISGNAGFNVSGGGILGGTGQVTGLAVQNSTVQPGLLGIGSLQVQGGPTFSSNSTFSTQIESSTANSSLAVTGGTTVLNQPTLKITIAPGVTPAAGSTFTIIQGNVSGTFANDPEGTIIPVGGSSFRISYHQGVTLTGVAPASIQTTTTVTPSANSSVFGQVVNFTAKVAPVAPGTGTPSGTVTFTDGSAVLTTLPLDASGTATYVSAGLAVATHSLVAVYNGSGSDASSTSSKLTFAVGPAATSTTLADSASTLAPGQLVTLTATITPIAPGAGAPTGMVVFHDGSSVIGTALVSAGQASITVSFAGVGKTHAIGASYQGTDSFLASNSPSQTVTVITPVATARLAAKPLFAGKKARGVTFQIVVQAGGTSLSVPSGSVVLEIGRKKFKTLKLASGSVSVFVPTAKAKGKSFVAQYLGDSNYKPVISNSFHVTAKFLKR